MARIAYEVKIGARVASSQARQGTDFLRALTCELSLDGAGGHCSVELLSTSAPPRPGEVTRITLDAGGGSTPVFTGEVLWTRASTAGSTVVGGDGLSRLARLDVEGAYAQVNAGTLVRELVGKAGLRTGKVEPGPRFPHYVLHRGPRALRHLRRLAEQCGCDLYTDGTGKVHFARPREGRADHTFSYPQQVLSAELARVPPAFDSLTVWGEGAASIQGAARGHWLVSSLASVSGKARLDSGGAARGGGLGKRSRALTDGAVRTGADAGEQARARMAQVGSRGLRGFVEVSGSPTVTPGDLVKLEDVPPGLPVRAQVNGRVLRVRTVRHRLDVRTGLVTRMEF